MLTPTVLVRMLRFLPFRRLPGLAAQSGAGDPALTVLGGAGYGLYRSFSAPVAAHSDANAQTVTVIVPGRLSVEDR
jgi:hypothetical protein